MILIIISFDILHDIFLHVRILYMIIFQIIACPLAVGVLSFEPPYMFYFLMAYYFFCK